MNAAISKEKLIEKFVEEHPSATARLKELTQEARKEKKSFFHLIVEKEISNEEETIEFLSEHLDIPMLNLAALRIPKEVIRLVPKKIVDRYQIIPFSRIKNLITIASSDPFELIIQDDLKELTNCDVVLALAPPKMISNAIESYYGESGTLEQMFEGQEDGELEVIGISDSEKEEQKKSADDLRATHAAPVVRMVNLILNEAIRMRASDIHFEPYEKNFRVRYRIDGALKESFSHSKELYGSLVARIKIMSQLDITEKRLPQDGRFRASINGREIDFRVSILPMYHGEKVVLRVLDRTGVKTGLDQLGFSEKPTLVFAEAIKHPYGLILVTGPTGSGKSTTLYTILSTLNTPDRNIMTIEDPVEYQIEGITQTQVNTEAGLTFASGLRSLLRQSPDIVLVGEIRDTETADIAVKAALTGHLVFSTLHTNSASGGITRLLDMGIEPFLIASSVISIAAQRLLRKVCPHCKAPYEISEDLLRRCNLKPSDIKGLTAYKGTGCAKCNNSGYFGRMGAVEILRVDPEIRELVIQKKSSDVIEKVGVEKGMETLFENAFSIFQKGLTTLEEVLRVTSQE